MTEPEWLACSPHWVNPMVHYLRGKRSERKLSLFVCGCCRRLWLLLHDERLREAVESAERNADLACPQSIPYGVSESVQAAYVAAYRRYGRTWNEYAALARSSAAAAVLCLGGGGQGAVSHHVSVAAKFWARSNKRAGRPAAKQERATCLQLLHCVAGNPFQVTAVAPWWVTSTVLILARTMYESRDFSAMPILGDALMDAGCDNEDILNHCRGPGPHVRGCWIVDLVLGKE